MTIALCAWLVLLSLLDAAFAGYRDAAGRNGRIFKDEFFRHGIRRGLRAGWVAVMVCAVWVGLAAAFSDDTARLAAELTAGASAMAAVLSGYAVLVLVAVALWFIAEANVRAVSSIILLGPLTLIRPFLVLLAGVIGAASTHSLLAGAVLLACCCTQLCTEPFLGRGWKRGSPLVV